MAKKAPIRVTILAGGQGTRFWPISRLHRPKQFLSISADGESLIQATARRAAPLADGAPPLVMTNIAHQKLIRDHLPKALVKCEPVARNTAASIGLAALYLKRESPETVMIVLPADHSVQDEALLVRTLEEAASLAANEDLLVTIGVKPTHPHTGYGYIKRGAALRGNGYMVGRFYEKPNIDRARKYCESNEFYWNSGMFAWRVATILDAIEQEMPELSAALQRIDNAIGQNNESEVVAKEFAAIDPISIDFGVLEHARNCAVVSGGDFGWSDIGSWDQWARNFAHDADNNLIKGDALVIASNNCLVHSEQRFTAVIGAENLVIIDAGDALLICSKDRVQEVRKVVEDLKGRGREDLI